MKRIWMIGISLSMALCLFALAGEKAQARELPVASDPSFRDNSKSKGVVQGTIEFQPAEDQSSITDYVIYFVDKNGEKLQFVGELNVAEMEENLAYLRGMGYDPGAYGFSIQEELELPAGAEYFGIYAKNGQGESDNGVLVYIWDEPVNAIQNLSFADEDSSRGKIVGTLRWESDPELELSGFSIEIFDGVRRVELPESYRYVEAGQTEYELSITSDVLPATAVSFQLRPLSEKQPDQPGPVRSVSITDDISGETSSLDVTTSQLPKPENASFTDRNPAPGVIAGRLSWQADDEEFIDMEYSSNGTEFVYSVYFLDDDDEIIQGISSIARNVYEYGYYDLLIDDTTVPEGAASIGVFVEMATAAGVDFGKIELRDDSGRDYYAKDVRFIDENPDPGVIDGRLTWQASDHEEEIAGYALFAGDETVPFLRVETEASASSYTADVPEHVVTGQYNVIRVIPYDAEEKLLYSRSFQDGATNVADFTLASESVAPGFLEYADRMHGSYHFKDEDPRPGYIGGLLEVNVQQAEGTVDWYFYDYKGDRIASLGSVSFAFDSTSGDKVYLNVPEGTEIPEGAVYYGFRLPLQNGMTSERGTFIDDWAAENEREFSDVDRDMHSIRRFASLGLINGYGDGTFRPQETITRAQFASIINQLYKLPDHSYDGTFTDVSADSWYASPIANAVHAGLLSGYDDGSFRPDQTIKYGEMYSILYRIYLWRGTEVPLNTNRYNRLNERFADWEQVPEWLHAALGQLDTFGVLPERGELNLDREVTRGDAVQTIYTFLTNVYTWRSETS